MHTCIHGHVTQVQTHIACQFDSAGTIEHPANAVQPVCNAGPVTF